MLFLHLVGKNKMTLKGLFSLIFLSVSACTYHVYPPAVAEKPKQKTKEKCFDVSNDSWKQIDCDSVIAAQVLKALNDSVYENTHSRTSDLIDYP